MMGGCSKERENSGKGCLLGRGQCVQRVGEDQGEFRIYRYLEEDAGGDRLGIRGLNTIL